MSRWEAELDNLVSNRGPALVGYAYMVCGDRRDAEDLVQEALVKLFSRLRRPYRATTPGSATVHALDESTTATNAEAYVRRTILNLYVDGYRRRVRFSERRHLVAEAEHGPGHASGVTMRADVAAALGSLSPQQRACVVLRFFDDLTVPQIAHRLGLAEGTVKRHLSNATTRLRGVLTPYPTTDDDRPMVNGGTAR